MQTNWQTKKLSDVCFFQEGPGIRKYEYKKNGYPIINVRCVQDGYIDLSNAQAVDPKFIKEKWAHFQVEERDILFTTSGTIGRTAMATKDDLPLLMNTSVVRFKSLDEKKLNKYFLAWLLRSPKFIDEVKSYSSGTAQKNVGPTHLKLISISFPPLPEQKRIVKILDEAFENVEKATENAEKNLQNSKELFESYLQNVFANPGKDWEEKKLGEVCDTGAGGTPLKSHKDYYEGGDIPWLRSGEVDKKDITTCELYITEKGLKNSSAKLFPPNTVLVAMYGATAGQVGILRFECSTNQAVCGILPNKNFIPEFLYYRFSAGKEVLVKQAVGGAQPNISQIKIRNTKVPVISIQEQKNIVKKLDSLSEQTKKLEAVYQKKLLDLEELKKSVLNKAFTGEL